ncbi:hypothetical protein ACJX0J_011863, partial [Zea mays]
AGRRPAIGVAPAPLAGPRAPLLLHLRQHRWSRGGTEDVVHREAVGVERDPGAEPGLRVLPEKLKATPNPRGAAPPDTTAPVPGDGTMRRQPFSRHAGFFSCLQRVEDRLASESEQQHQEQKESPPPPATAKATATTRQTEASPFSDTMTASPLLFLDPAAPAPAPGSSSGPALDFLTAATQEGKHIQQEDDDNDGGGDGDEEDIARLMELLGLSSGGGGSSRRDDDGGGCDCSG